MEKKTVNKKNEEMSEVKTNPLRNERVFVRFVPHENNSAGSDKRHPMWGNKADGTTLSLCAPVLRSTGTYKNILTDDEKDVLEAALGLDSNALSVYKKEDNFWDDFYVTWNVKEGLYLDLSNPEDYIKYKILLAYNDIVAPSVEERLERPKQSYQCEIVREHEETSLENVKMDAIMASFDAFKKIQNDLDTMRVLVEILDGRPYSPKEKREFFRARINSLIQSNPKVFLKNITDPMLHSKVLIRRGCELGILSKRSDYYYVASDGTPMSDGGENPTLSLAAEWLNLPAHQDIKFILENEVDKNRV